MAREFSPGFRAKVKQINDEFLKWFWTDEARKKDLLKTYNAEFNSTVLRTYDSSNLTFPGLAKDVCEKLAAAMEMKRLGIIKKPLFTVPNNVVNQFVKDFRLAYPQAQLLILTNLHCGKKFC